ncbi:metallophosphoesterase [Pseudochelatococcus sp. B33]
MADHNRERAEREIAAVNAALLSGSPPTVVPGSNLVRSAGTAAAAALGTDRRQFHFRVGKPGKLGLWHRRYGLSPDWALYQPKETPEPEAAGPTVDDRVRERRLEQEVASLRKREKALLDQVISLQDARTSIFGLAESLGGPALIVPKPGSGKGGNRSVILHISDVHAGEAVDLYEMDGLNSYNGDICRARMQRLFRTAASLMTEHWAGDAPEEIIVCLGGDMIDNNLREESRRGGAMPVVESAKLIAEVVAGGLIYLHEHVGVPIRVYTSPGNHGRLVAKPHSNEGNIDNWDVMVSWSVEKIVGPQDWIRFFYTGSGEALFNIYGWWFLLQHGHEGTGGTGGLYGPVYKQVRGMYRTHQTYGRRGRGFHFVLQGHDHSPVKIPFGFGNGSVVGFNAFAARSLKADPSPASQNMLVVERALGVIAWHELFLGMPSEGSLYEPPAIDANSTGKPVVRVKASAA